MNPPEITLSDFKFSKARRWPYSRSESENFVCKISGNCNGLLRVYKDGTARISLNGTLQLQGYEFADLSNAVIKARILWNEVEDSTK